MNCSGKRQKRLYEERFDEKFSLKAPFGAFISDKDELGVLREEVLALLDIFLLTLLVKVGGSGDDSGAGQKAEAGVGAR